MKEPVLVIMAAGMGSRYGGLKQIDPVDPQGHKILDFSLFDAKRAGFKKAVFIIKKENEQIFRECVGDPVSRHMEVEYVFQDLNDVPEGFVIPEERVKPWGTAHAVYSCRKTVDEPFAVINADDYYGVEAFRLLYDFLRNNEDDDKYRYAMVGYRLGNTLTEHGSVARGCCETENGYLVDIAERTHIIKTDDGAAYSEDGGETYTSISPDSLVSMNMWAFTPGVIGEMGKSLENFFANKVKDNPLKAECYLPIEVGELLKEGKASVQVLSSPDKWFGVTYKEDKPMVEQSIRELKDKGIYPEQLWK